MKRLLSSLILCLLTASSVRAASTEFEYDFDFDAELTAFSGDSGNRPELLILSPLLERKVLGRSMTVYEFEGRFYFPLYALSRALEIGIFPVPGGKGARGFIIDEGRPFLLDLKRSRVEFADQTAGIDEASVKVHANDVYIVQELISTWLPLDFKVHRLRSALEIKPREQTPIQKRWEREKRLKYTKGFSKDRYYPRMVNEYRPWDGPYIDETLLARSSTAGGPLLAHSTYIAADLAYAEANAYIAGDQDELIGAYRVNLGRKDPYGRLLGPLQARDVQAVDVFSPRVSLLWPNRQVRGGLISSYPLGVNADATSRTFDGDLPPGWTVELYRDDFLVDFRRADLTGRYIFQDVPLEYGYNRYRLVFYGPYGQRREEVYYANLSDIIPEQGNLFYHLSAGEEVDAGGTRALLQADYGLGANLSLRAGFAHSSLRDTAESYGIAGLRGAVGPAFSYADIYYGEGGAGAASVGGFSRVGVVTLHSEYDYAQEGFSSEAVSSGRRGLQDRFRLGADTYLNDFGLPLALGVEGVRDRYRHANTSYGLIQRTSLSWQQLAFTNRVEWRNRLPLPSATTFGNFSVSRSLNVGAKLLVLGEVGYALYPEPAFSQLGMRVTSLFASRFVGFVGARRAFQGETSFDAGVANEFDVVGVQLTTSFTHPNELEVMGMLTAGFGASPRLPNVEISGRQIAKQGNILVRAYLDRNQNGRWDAGEEAVPDVTVMVDGVSHKERTGRNGMVLVKFITPYQPVDLTVSADRVEDPSWKSRREGVSVVPRPGRAVEVDFPFEPTGEIEGTVYFNTGGNAVERAGVLVQLLDPSRTVVKSQWSAYDGFYLFLDIPNGDYTVRISPDFVSGWKTNAPEKAVTVSDDEPIVYGTDLILHSN